MYTNAGRVRFAPIHETTPDDWHFNLANELTISFLGCKFALRAMFDQGSGSIINVSAWPKPASWPRLAREATVTT